MVRPHRNYNENYVRPSFSVEIVYSLLPVLPVFKQDAECKVYFITVHEGSFLSNHQGGNNIKARICRTTI